MPIVNQLLKESAITIKEEIYEQYKPKLVKYVRLHSAYTSDESLNKLLEELARAKNKEKPFWVFFNYQLLKNR